VTRTPRDLEHGEHVPGQLTLGDALPSPYGPAIVTQGDAAHLHLPDASVDLIVTSPPYFGLRSYQDGGEHYQGQIGDEPTPREYLDALITCTAEWMRVLKPGGSIFVNLGDKYSGAQGQAQTGVNGRRHMTNSARTWQQTNPRNTGIPAKSLMMLPQRYAIRAVDELGLIVRAEIVWAKPNGLPESVTDRVRRSHEQVFHFVKSPRYYTAVDEIREVYNGAHGGQNGATPYIPDGYKHGVNHGFGASTLRTAGGANPLGKLPGSVWSIPTAPLRVPPELGVDHFAAYPPELVRRIILAWSPRDVCTDCGEGRRPVAERASRKRHNNGKHGPTGLTPDNRHGRNNSTLDIVPDYRITGYACACSDTTAPATPGVVLDPFGGTGTTALVASVHGRVGISVDLSEDYCRLARWRVADAGERARALDVPKPPPVAAEQLDMFGGEAWT
jgi:DNA modification methylase